MLVLARRRGQSITINGNIVITVLDVQKDVVKIGIAAPREIDIYRTEIFQAIQEENRRAAATQDVVKLIAEENRVEQKGRESE